MSLSMHYDGQNVSTALNVIVYVHTEVPEQRSAGTVTVSHTQQYVYDHIRSCESYEVAIGFYGHL